RPHCYQAIRARAGAHHHDNPAAGAYCASRLVPGRTRGGECGVRRCRERKGCGMNAHAAAIEAFINETTRCFGAPPVEVLLRRHSIEKENDMTDYDNRNRGALFRNDDKDPNDDKERDYSGTLDVEGTEYWLSGWVRTSKNG